MAQLAQHLPPHIITTLPNTFLVATASHNNTMFERAVIYLVNHGPEGAMGLTINQPHQGIAFPHIMQSMGIEEMLAASAQQPIILKGGPVEHHRGFVLHTADYSLSSTLQLGSNIALSASADIVTDIARGHGPKALNFCLGYAGWGPGQLEEELHENDWLVVPADAKLLFHTPANLRYAAATQKLGLDALNFPDSPIGLA